MRAWYRSPALPPSCLGAVAAPAGMGFAVRGCLIAVLVCASAAATGHAGGGSEEPKVSPNRARLAPLAGRVYGEGFEAGVPPQGWSISQTNPRATWQQSPVDPFEGAFCATCPYDDRLGEQEEWLSFLRTIAPDEATLTFAVMGSVYWSTTPRQNYNLLVAIDGTVVWDFRSANRGTSWVWEVHRVDLRAHAGRTVLIGFGYVGSDGAEGSFDAVSLNDYVVPPPPANDDCAGASRIPCGDYSIIGSTALASNDYSPSYPSSCTGYSANGPDLVYFTDLRIGERLSVSMDTVLDWDDSVYLLTDCGEGGFTCVAGDDAYPDMSAFEYTATSAGRYYLVVDGFGGASGEFSISGANGCTSVPVRSVRWSTLKAIFR